MRSVLRANAASADENMRIRMALDDVPSAVLIADTAGVIRYANKSVIALLTRIADDLRTVVPNFDVKTIIGSNFDIFHRNPAHQRRLVEGLTGPHRAQWKFGGCAVQLTPAPSTTTPVLAPVRCSNGSTAPRRSMPRRRSPPSSRAPLRATSAVASRWLPMPRPSCRTLGSGVNELLGTTEHNLSQVSETLSRVAAGDLTRSMEGEHAGIFGQLQGDVNRMVGQLVETISQVNSAAQALNAAGRPGVLAPRSRCRSRRPSRPPASRRPPPRWSR